MVLQRIPNREWRFLPWKLWGDLLVGLISCRMMLELPTIPSAPSLAIEPGPMAWGTKLIQLSDVDSMCNWVMKDGTHNGVFIWSNDKVTTGSPTVAAITAEIVKVFGAISPVPVTVQVPLDGNVTPTPHTTPTIPCPNCGKSLEIILA